MQGGLAVRAGVPVVSAERSVTVDGETASATAMLFCREQSGGRWKRRVAPSQAVTTEWGSKSI